MQTDVIFRDESGKATDAQLLAFEDTWHWGPSAEAIQTTSHITAPFREFWVLGGTQVEEEA